MDGGLEFGRQTYVGVSSDPYGSITVGRQYNAVVDYLGIFEGSDQGGGYIAAHPADINSARPRQRVWSGPSRPFQVFVIHSKRGFHRGDSRAREAGG